MSNIHSGHRKRIKEEFRQSGLDHFSHHRILEFLLFYSIPRADTNATGHRLIDRFGTFSGVFDASYELLCEVEGVSEETATYIKLISSVIRTYMEDVSSRDNMINDIEAAKNYMMSKFLGETVECLYFAGLGNNGRVLFCKKLSEGTPETVGVAPATVVKAALRADAAKAILAHNHPYGICNPSSADVRTTSLLFDELRRVDVELVDHIIVAPDGVCSMRELGMMPNPSVR
ncbi:hypothetical protein LJC63_04340 [Ruminococcaceae bacterium OttesenSCG-928-L11]|nr:hypothetical protein [Ruminococcaceae bacterium OttesenSCG-928-L11]